MSLRSRQARICKCITHLHTLDRLHRHDRHGKLRFETPIPLRKASQPNRHIQGNDLQHTTQRVPAMNGFFNLRPHLICRYFDGTTHIRLLGADKTFFVRHVAKSSSDPANRRSIAPYNDPELSEEMFAYGADSHTHGRLASGGTLESG